MKTLLIAVALVAAGCSEPKTTLVIKMAPPTAAEVEEHYLAGYVAGMTLANDGLERGGIARGSMLLRAEQDVSNYVAVVMRRYKPMPSP